MTVILRGVVGSTAYGLATADSDVDRMGVYVGPTRKVLGFGLSKDAQTHVTMKPDLVIHEVGKFARLALECNPSVLELLWLSSYDVEATAGHDLRTLREDFLSHGAVVDSYGRYAIDQAKRLLRRRDEGKDGFGEVPAKRTAKHARHCYRLLIQGEDLLKTGRLQVRLMPWQVEKVMAVGQWAVDDRQAFHDAMIEKAAELEAMDSRLPDQPDRGMIEEWLVSVRIREMAGMLR